jgi:hypothetical protein
MKCTTIAGIGGTLPAAAPPLRRHSLSAIRRIANETPAGFAGAMPVSSGALQAPVDVRRGCPANSGYQQQL